MQTKRTSTLIIFRHAPYASGISKAGLDYVLAASVFEQPISCLFMDHAVLQLLNNQHSHLLQQKNQQKLLQALELYEVKTIYVEQLALSDYKLSADDLCINCTPIYYDELQQLIRQHQQVLSF